jgi:micrococcal nuclease
MYEYYVKEVTKVVDGDTIDVIIDLGFDIMFASRVRLAGIDTPESRTRDKFEKALGLESKKYLADRLKDAKNIVIKTEKINSTEKFGRVLGWLYINGEAVSLNEEMVSTGYAWKYLGATKVKDFDELLAKRS